VGGGTASGGTGDLGNADELSASRSSRNGLVRAGRDALYLLVVLAAVGWVYIWVRSAIRDDAIGFDFEGTLWDPALALRDGRSPYPAATLAEVDVNNPALYPPVLPLALVPLTVLPWSIGVTVWIMLLGGSLALTLYALDVRDPRCYVVTFISAPAATGLVFGNVTLLLIPLVALAWRWRDRWPRSGLLVGLAIASKLFAWPLVFWLLGTRRYKAAGTAVVTAVIGLMVPWALIRFDGFFAYPDLLQVASEIYGTHSLSVTTMLSALGLETELATLGAPIVGMGLAALAFLAGRRTADEVSLSVAVLALIFASPIVWDHNYAFLLIPLAIVWPRFAAPWLLLPLLYLTYRLPRPWLPYDELEPGGTACCPPEDVPKSFWALTHADPALWPALGYAALWVGLVSPGVVPGPGPRPAPVG